MFLNWRESLLKSEEEINLKYEDNIRKDFSNKLLFCYANYFKDNDTTTELLNNEELIKLCSLFVSGNE